jgi:hypothetical protein
LDGVEIPGVTSVMQAEGLIDLSGIPDERLEIGQQLGTAVHAACEYDDSGDLDPTSVAPEIAGYLDQWRKFKTDLSVEIIRSEKMYYHKNIGYAGQIDRVVSINGRPVVIDIKSGAKNESVAIQLEAYRELILHNEPEISKKKIWTMAVYLRPDKYEICEYREQWKFLIFISALNLYRYKKGIK